MAQSLTEHREIPLVGDVHPPSFAFGVMTALVLVIGAKLLWGSAKLVLKIGAIAALVVLLGGTYFGWVKRSAGLGDSKMASPQELIEEAQKAAAAAKKQIEEQQKQLKKLEEQRK